MWRTMSPWIGRAACLREAAPSGACQALPKGHHEPSRQAGSSGVAAEARQGTAHASWPDGTPVACHVSFWTLHSAMGAIDLGGVASGCMSGLLGGSSHAASFTHSATMPDGSIWLRTAIAAEPKTVSRSVSSQILHLESSMSGHRGHGWIKSRHPPEAVRDRAEKVLKQAMFACEHAAPTWQSTGAISQEPPSARARPTRCMRCMRGVLCGDER